MKLVSFSVRDYRSLTQTQRLRIGHLTVLIGPNNEGKSNVLRALATALAVAQRLERLERFSTGVVPHWVRQHYDWENDYPISKQEAEPNGQSTFRLEFELTPDEVNAFWDDTHSTLNGTLPIEISIGRRGVVFKVRKKGPGGTKLSQKAGAICRFLSKRLDLQYIPAIRTAQASERVIEEIVDRELKSLEDNLEYRQALQKVSEIQQPLLERIGDSIRDTLTEFLPAVRNVSVEVTDARPRYAPRRAYRVLIDDGTPTELQHKGDGVQSLAALSLIRQATEQSAAGRNLILAVEEPEAHLHPMAIHRLKRVISEIAQRHQIIIASHSPLFVDRREISTNIIVEDNVARTAKSLAEIREVLGVRASDNLLHAELVVLVEGPADKRAIEALAAHASTTVRKALDGHRLVFDFVGGAGNLGYKLGLVRALMCDVHVVLDNDAAGRDAFETAAKDGLLTEADCTFTTCPGSAEAEFEDLLDPALYAEVLQVKYGVRLDVREFRNSRKWSVRMREVFLSQGKQWTVIVEDKVKDDVAEAVAASPDKALHEARRGAIDALANSLEGRLRRPLSMTGRNRGATSSNEPPRLAPAKEDAGEEVHW